MSIVDRYSMDDNAASTVVLDSVGAYNGTARVNTDTLDVAGKINGALSFNGTEGTGGDRIAVSRVFSPPFSMGGWIYWSTGATQFVMMANGFSYPGSQGYMLRYDASGMHPFKGHNVYTKAYTMPAATWKHIVMTVGSTGTIKLYIDAVLLETFYTSVMTSFTSTSYWGVEYNSSSGYILNLKGRLDNCIFVDHEMTLADIQAEYEAVFTNAYVYPSAIALTSAVVTPGGISDYETVTIDDPLALTLSGQAPYIDALTNMTIYPDALALTTAEPTPDIETGFMEVDVSARTMSINPGVPYYVIAERTEIGMKYRHGGVTYPILGEILVEETHKLRMRGRNITWGISLVDPAATNASPIRIYDGAAVKALAYVPELINLYYGASVQALALTGETPTIVITGVGTFGNEDAAGISSSTTSPTQISLGRFTLSENGDVTKLTGIAWASSGTINAKGLIYNDSTATPNALQGTSGATAVTGQAAYDFTFASPVSLTAGDYWLGIVGESATVYLKGVVGGGDHHLRNNLTGAYASPPDPFGTATASGTENLNIYATYTYIS